MDLAYYYELWRGMMLSKDPLVAEAVTWWQEFYVKFYQAFLVSIVVTVCGTIVSVLCMMLAAYPLSKRELPLRRTIMIYFFISMLFSGGMVPNYILVSSLGLTNTLFAMILPNAVMVFHLILMKAFFEGIPPALEESARIDGAGNLRILFSIIMPISMSMIVTVCLFTAVVYWNNYFNALMYISASHSELYPLPFFVSTCSITDCVLSISLIFVSSAIIAAR